MPEISTEDKNDWVRPPENIEFTGMIITEVFEESKFDELREGLEEIYEDNNLEYRIERLKDIFERPSVGSWGNSNIQVSLKNERESNELSGHQIQFEDLGPYVKSVNFSLARVSPSFIVLRMNLTFTDEGKEILNDIYTYTHEEFKEEVKGAEKIHNPTNLKKEEIEHVKNQAAEDVLNIVENYFRGALSEDSEEYEKLVKIPVYCLESLSDYENSLDKEDQFEDKEDIEKFSASNASFLNTLGVNLSGHSVYEHEYYFLSCDSKAAEVFTDFSIFTDEDLKKDMLEGRGDHWGVMDYLQMDFQRTVTLMALSRYSENFSHKVDSYSRKLSDYEQKSYSIPGLASYRKFRKIKKLKEERISDRRYFSRFSEELDQFKPLKSGLTNIKTENSFIDDTKEYIKNLGERQESIAQDNDDFYQEMIDLSKISANYSLQFWVFFLTLVIVVLELLRALSFIGSQS